MMRDFIDYYAAHIADASRPFDGLESALDELQAQRISFAVCTNKLEWLSKLLLDRLGLSRAVFGDLRRRHLWRGQTRSRRSCGKRWPAPAGTCQRRSWSAMPVRMSEWRGAPAFP